MYTSRERRLQSVGLSLQRSTVQRGYPCPREFRQPAFGRNPHGQSVGMHTCTGKNRLLVEAPLNCQGTVHPAPGTAPTLDWLLKLGGNPKVGWPGAGGTLP